jgi:von Willebrand factor type A domain
MILPIFVTGKRSTAVKREFDLKKYTTKSSVLSAVDRIAYEAGGTNTHLALDELRKNGFIAANGARADHPKVAIVLTDGQSNQPPLTITAALRCHDASYTVYLRTIFLQYTRLLITQMHLTISGIGGKILA